MYKLTNDANIIKNIETGYFIPKGNKLWGEYQTWLEGGNTPSPYETPEEIIEKNAASIRAKRNSFAVCAIDSKSQYEREQESILNGITVSSPMIEADYIVVLQYIQDLFDITEQSGFPWDGPDDPSCPWPVKPDCVCETSII